MKTIEIGRRGNIRNDYNENHDEKGRFSVSDASGGGSSTTHATLKEAKSQAKTTSSMFSGTFHVKEGGTIHAAFYQGKPATIPGYKGAYGTAKHSHDGVEHEHKGGAVMHGHAANMRDIPKYEAIKASESPAGANARAIEKLPGGASGPVADTVRYHQSHAEDYRIMAANAGAGTAEGKEHSRKSAQHDAAAKAILNKAAEKKPVTPQVPVMAGMTPLGMKSAPGVEMRAQAGDKQAIKEMKDYRAKNAVEKKAISAAFKGYTSAGEKRGGHVPMTDAQFSKLTSKGSYTVLTPANPMSKALTPKENAYRMKEAVKDLNRMGAKYVITAGKYGNAEPGFTILHDEKFGVAQARELGRKYNQTSVMHVENGKATIYHTTGQFAGRVQRSTGFSFEPGAKDNFTGRGNVKYSFHFPDESWSNPEKE